MLKLMLGLITYPLYWSYMGKDTFLRFLLIFQGPVLVGAIITFILQCLQVAGGMQCLPVVVGCFWMFVVVSPLFMPRAWEYQPHGRSGPVSYT